MEPLADRSGAGRGPPHRLAAVRFTVFNATLVAGAAAALLAASAGIGRTAYGQAQEAAGALSIRLDGPARQGALVRGTAPPGTVSLTLDGRDVPLASDGRFLLGFDRDTFPTARLAARFADGREQVVVLTVSPRAWPIERLGIPRPSGGPTPEFRRLREGELVRIAAARAQRTASSGWAQAFIWPARGRLSGVFGAQRIYRGGVRAAYHSGTDVAAGAGAVVVAPADGVVTLAPPPMFSLEGNLVILDHGMGLNSAFLHLARVSVGEGQAVRQGQPIGTVGATGRASGPHLHWSLVWNGARIDPQSVTGPMN
jgi:murein DD-endopeptidase MepM/ murein hydrolase activator NlpD